MFRHIAQIGDKYCLCKFSIFGRSGYGFDNDMWWDSHRHWTKFDTIDELKAAVEKIKPKTVRWI